MIAANVSVIIPCYKMGRYVAEALDSVGSQTYPDWEIIIVDDAGPEDGTRQAVTDFARRFPTHRVEFIRHKMNRGVSAARNTAINAAKGKYLAFLDPDDLWLPEKLLKQLQALEADEDAAISYSQAKILRQGLAPQVEFNYSPPETETTAAVLGIANGKVVFAFSSLVLKKEIVEKVGGFRENLPFQNEDRLLIGSCAFFGRMTWIAEPLCVYRLHDSSATTSVIKNDIVHLVEFDLVARLALWLRRQPGGKITGSQIVEDILRKRFRKTMEIPSWFRSRALIVSLCAQLAWNYPSVTAFLIWQFVKRFRALMFRRQLLNHNC